MLRTKDEAMQKIRNLLHAGQRIVKEHAKNKERLEEVRILANDYEIGLELFEEQRQLLQNKETYEILDKFLSSLMKDNSLDNKINEIDNEDSWIQNLVECIFLEKKHKEEVVVIDSKEQEVVFEKSYESIDNAFEVVNVKKETVEVKKIPVSIRDEVPEISGLDENIAIPKERVPFAWKNGKNYSGGSREKHREAEKSKKYPSKEYRGFYTKKSERVPNKDVN